MNQVILLAVAALITVPTMGEPKNSDPHAGCKKEISELEAKVRELHRKNKALEKECATLTASLARARVETKQLQATLTAKLEKALGRTESQVQRIRQVIKDETLVDGMTVDEAKEALSGYQGPYIIDKSSEGDTYRWSKLVSYAQNQLPPHGGTDTTQYVEAHVRADRIISWKMWKEVTDVPPLRVPAR